MGRLRLWFRRWLQVMALMMLMLPALGCNLDSSASSLPTPTTFILTGGATGAIAAPLVGLNPVSGPPNTTVTLMAGGFPLNVQLNVFISALNTPNSAPITVLTANGGAVTYSLALPQQLNGVALANGTPLLFTVSTVGGGASATALF